ncbi:efflux RND transporter permease subunit [Parvibium lacunae]|nr:CusA/CzcA family heavy metal efflux RND transporter [Parvibium lacunae]
MRALIAFAIQQRAFILLLTGLLAVFGFRSFSAIPIEAFPDVQDVQVQIVTQYQGQAPEEVERAISLPIEREMSGVPRMTQMRSISITGLSIVTLTFADGTDDHFARAKVLEKLQQVSLPPDAQPVLAPLTTAVGEIYRYILEIPESMSLREARAIHDWVIRPELRFVPGVADIVSYGATIKQYQVRINPSLLKKFGVTINDVAQALEAGSSNVGGGTIRTGEEAYVLRSVGIFRSLDDIGDVIVADRQGKTITVRDIAIVQIGDRPRTGVVSFTNTEESKNSVVQGIVQMTKGQNPAVVIAALKEKIELLNINGRLPKEIRIRPIYDRTKLIDNTLHTVGHNLLVGAALVVGILLVFLRNWRAALIVAAVIPLSLLFAFIAMDLKGLSANLISLGAVDFGIIIDSAVVMVEALMVKLAMEHQNLAMNIRTPERALGWRLSTLRTVAADMAKPILFSKIIIILAFLPIFTFQRVEGRIFSPVAFTLSAALIGAILLTLLLVPVLLAFTMHRSDMGEKHLAWMEALQKGYRHKLQQAMMFKNRVIYGSLVILALTLSTVPLMGTEFLPKLDEGNIWLTISLAPSTNLVQSKEMEETIRSVLRTYPEVNMMIGQVGRPDDGTDPKGPNNIEILADLKPHSSWRPQFKDKEALVSDMSRALSQIPGLPTNFSQVIQDNVEESLSGAKGEIAVKIFGPDLEILQDKAELIETILKRIPGNADVAAIPVGGQAEVTITPDRRKMARYGINIADINRVIATAFGGADVNDFFEGDRKFDVTLRLPAEYRDSMEDILNLQVPIPSAIDGNIQRGNLTLSELATVEIRQGASRIAREGGGRVGIVKTNIRGRDMGSFVREAQQQVKKEIHLPPGYFITWGGQFENQQRASKRLAVIVPISLLGIFIVLFWAFRSTRLALLVLGMVPFTLIGGLAGLGLAGLNLSISAAVGFIAVAGISVQNGVILVEQYLDNLQNGEAPLTALVEGAIARLRPILMTALMAGFGLLPAALSNGIGSETQRPFAIVIVGGIISATCFTLFLLPVLLARFGLPPTSTRP